jgi:hypothetical protein
MARAHRTHLRDNAYQNRHHAHRKQQPPQDCSYNMHRRHDSHHHRWYQSWGHMGGRYRQSAADRATCAGGAYADDDEACCYDGYADDDDDAYGEDDDGDADDGYDDDDDDDDDDDGYDDDDDDDGDDYDDDDDNDYDDDDQYDGCAGGNHNGYYESCVCW